MQREAREAVEEEEEETHNSPSIITNTPKRNDKTKKTMIQNPITVQNRKANKEKTLFCFFFVSSESILSFLLLRVSLLRTEKLENPFFNGDRNTERRVTGDQILWISDFFFQIVFF